MEPPPPPAPLPAPWYAAHFGPAFADLLTGILTAYLGQPLAITLTSGAIATGVCASVAPGAGLTLASCTLTPAPAAQLLLPAPAPPGTLLIPLAQVHAVRLPQGACVPRALAEAARAHLPRAAPRTTRGPRLPSSSSSSSATGDELGAAPAATPVLGLSWALHGWGEGGLTL